MNSLHTVRLRADGTSQTLPFVSHDGAVNHRKARDRPRAPERRFTPWHARRAFVAMLELGTVVSYRGRLQVVIGVTPMGASPQALELEDLDSGRIRSVERADPDLVIGPAQGSPARDESDE
jgi:hypothetical protein